MSKSLKTRKRHAIEALGIFLFGMASIAVFCRECLWHLPQTWQDFVYSGLMWMFLWKGNELLAVFPNRFLPWKEYPVRRLIVGIAVHLSYTLIAATLILEGRIFMEEGSFRTLSLEEIVSNHSIAVLIAILITLFLTARSFLLSWRDLAVEHEQLKTESMASRLASLKAQVNPHFLFNSLTVLSGLVYRDADLSARFIKKLSEVYRYVLDQQEEMLVPVGEELAFVESVVFLQRIRFGEHLHVHCRIPADATFLVAPMALQMLIENAIKHNIISEQHPLHIRISAEEGYLVVSNNLQPKQDLRERLGIGLENIRKRYGFLTERPVRVERQNGQFLVKLPVIEAT